MSASAPFDEEEGCRRSKKMARVGRKYAALFDLSGSGAEDANFASRVLRFFASVSWSDPSFLEELVESGLIGTICRALPVLKVKATTRASADCVQDLADLEEAIRKLRHELGVTDKRLPNNGSSSSSLYPSWSCVGYVSILMLQALTHSASTAAAMAAAAGTQTGPAVTPRATPVPDDLTASRGTPAPEPAGPPPGVQPTDGTNAANAAQQPGSQAPAQPAGGAADNAAGGSGAASAAGAAQAGTHANERPGGAARASPAPAAGAAAAAGASGRSGSSTPTRVVGASKAGGSATTSPGASGGGMPVIATEAGLIKLLSHKNVVPRAKEVLRVVSDEYRAELARVVLTQIGTELKATLSGVTHILQILKGDPAATSPAPSSLPKAWFATATMLSAFSEALKAAPAPTANAGQHGSNGGAAGKAAGASGCSGVAAASAGAQAASANGSTVPGATHGPAAPAPDGGGDVEMTDAVGASAPAGGPSTSAGGAAGTASADDNADKAASEADPRVAVEQLLQDVAAALREAVTGAHGVGRMALLLRGEATAKYSSVAAFMPSALSINELMLHLDALACVGAALGPAATDRLRSDVAGLLQSGAVKELLGAGKVYVTTVIAAGALTRDLAIDAVIPQSLRNGYMSAVMTPLETGALLNERRMPQVLAYRNSITESSYYQVMDAESLPFGVNVRFEDEQEAEGMGVVREWLSQIAADLFAPERGLFVRGAADRRVVHPSPLSTAQDDWKGYMRFAGRIVGLALRANVPLGAVLSTGLFKYLTGRQAGLQDLEQIDPQVYTTCNNILANPGAEALDLYHVWHTRGGSATPLAPSGAAAAAAGSGPGPSAAAAEAGAGSAGTGRPVGQSAGAGAEVEVELLPGGSKLRVTDANKAEYVELLANHLVTGAVEEQCAAFLQGLQDTAAHLPEEPRLRRAFLAPLQLEDLNRITAGESSLDPDEWAAHTEAAGFDSAEEAGCVEMFWQLVAEYSPEDRQRLLQFWTAMTHLPSGGFKALNQRLQIMKLGPPAGRRPSSADGAPADGGAAPASPVRGQAAAAAAAGTPPPPPAAEAPGPSPGGAGPHSHQLDSDGLDGEEQEDAASEPPAEGAAAAPPPPPADAAQQAPNGPQPPEGAPAAGPATEAPAGGGGGAQAPSAPPSADGGDGGEAPYGGEEYDDGDDGDGDGMGYGDEEDGDEEEFQRQLAMALALSMQEMPPPQQPPQQPPQGGNQPSGDGAGGSGAGANGNAGDDNGAGPTGDSGSGAGDGAAAGGGAAGTSGAAQGAAGSGAAAAAEPMRPEGPGGSAAPTGAGSAAGAANGEAHGGGEEPNKEGAQEAAAAPSDGAAVGQANGAAGAAAPATAAAVKAVPVADGDAEMHMEPAAPASAKEDGGGGGPAAASGPAAGAGPSALHDAAAASAAETSGTAATATSNGPSRDGDGPSGSGQPAGNGNAAGAPHDPMDTDGTAGGPAPAAAMGAGEGAAGNAAPAPEGVTEQPQDAAQPQPQQEQGQAGAEAPDQGPAPPGDAAAAQPEHQEQRGGAGPAPMDAEGAGAAPAVAAATPPPAGRAALMLPQARTCFLQLNLPVYKSLEDMRRAFNIALDNMSFGLH